MQPSYHSAAHVQQRAACIQPIGRSHRQQSDVARVYSKQSNRFNGRRRESAHIGDEERTSTPSESSSGSDPSRRKRRRGRRGGRRSERETTAVQRSSETVPGLGDQPTIADASGEPPEEAVAQPASHEDGGRPNLRRLWINPIATSATGRIAAGAATGPSAANALPARKTKEMAQAPGTQRLAIAPAITASEAPPRPAEKRPEPAPAPEPRKWQPPAPTLAERPPQPKAGWWSKR